jgi:hypothetical protein
VNEFQPLIDQLYREKVLRARKRTPGERMSDVLELSTMHFTKDGPELRRRLGIVRTMEERGCYGPPQPRL